MHTMHSFLVLLLCFLSLAQDAKPVYGNASDNLILAQQLVYDLLAAYDDLLVIGIHGATNTSNGTTIAINLDRIGKPDVSDDDAVAVDHKTIMAPNPTDPHKWEIATPLYTKDSMRLNASINMVFNYTEGRQGDDLLGLLARAVVYEKQASKMVATYEDLFMPVPMLHPDGSCYASTYM